MNTKTIAAIVLIALGIGAIAYSGISFTTPGESVEFLGVCVGTRDTHFIPPIAGAAAIAGGILLPSRFCRRHGGMLDSSTAF